MHYFKSSQLVLRETDLYVPLKQFTKPDENAINLIKYIPLTLISKFLKYLH